MRTTLRFIAAASTMFLATAAQATTTLYKFCSDSADGSTYTDNRAAATDAGWTITDIGTTVGLGDGTYTDAFRLKNSTSVASPTFSGGLAITKAVIGARVTNVARVYHVMTSTGVEKTATPSTTGVREELTFDFDSHDGVSSITITTPSGTGNSYIYDISLTTIKPLSAPADISVSGEVGANGFDVEWGGVEGATGYSVVLFDAGGTVVSASDVPSATTSASFDGLTSSSEYTVSVVALGDGETTDDSRAATLAVTTAASATAAPTLDVAVTSWTAGVAGTSAVSAMLESGAECDFESVSMSDGSAASVENGTLSWTPPASTEASTVTATFHVVNGTDGWDVAQVLSVAATPAPAAPSIEFSNVSARSFDAAWTPGAGGPVSEWKVRAWSGRETPDDATGSAREDFAGYMLDNSVPAGWTFKNTGVHYNQEATPVDFKSDNEWIATPDYGGTITEFSFKLRLYSESGSTFTVYGSSGSADPEVWKTDANTIAKFSTLATDEYVVSVEASRGVSRLFFQYTKATGNVAFGTFRVSGVDWPAADFVEGWGGAKVSVGTDVSRTILGPAAGKTNWVEVTAVGPTGLTAATVRPVVVPRLAPTRITVF